MTESEIKAKLDEISGRFDELKAQKDQIDQELYRLQGEYRVYEQMKPAPKAKVGAK